MNRVVITVESENRCHLSDRSAVELRILQISCASTKWKVNKMDRGQGTVLCMHGTVCVCTSIIAWLIHMYMYLHVYICYMHVLFQE